MRLVRRRGQSPRRALAYRVTSGRSSAGGLRSRAGRGGAGRVERRVPAAAARGQPGSVLEAGRTPGESGVPGAAPLSGPGLRAPGRAFGSVAGTAGACGAALERRVGPGSCCARGGDEPGGRGARAGPEPRSLPPCPPPAWPGARGWPGEARGSAWARPPERLVLSVRPLAYLGPSGGGGRRAPALGGRGERVGGRNRRRTAGGAGESAPGERVNKHGVYRPPAGRARAREGPRGDGAHHLSALGLAFGEDPALQMVGLGPGHRGFRPQLSGQEWESNSTWCPGGCEEGGMEVALNGQTGFLTLSTSFSLRILPRVCFPVFPKPCSQQSGQALFFSAEGLEEV